MKALEGNRGPVYREDMVWGEAGVVKTLALWACVGVLVSACGGDGAAPAAGAKGKVLLPAGFALAPAELEIVTAVGTVRPAADASFVVPTLDAEPTQLDVLGPDGRLVLIGMATDGVGEISVSTTAAGLLYEALGGPLLPAAHARTLQALIAGLPELDGLTAALTAALERSVTALADGDPTLTTALQTARDAALAYTVPAEAPRLPRSAFAPLAAAGADLLIEPGGDTLQSGVAVLHNPVGAGLVAQNHFRRPATLIAYRVAADDADGVKQDVTPPVEVGRMDLVSTGKLELFTALSDVVLGTAPFSPTLTASLDLPLAESGKRAYYEAIVLGPTLDPVTTPPLYGDARFAPFRESWNEVVRNQSLALFFGELVVPIVESFVFGHTGLIQPSKVPAIAQALGALSNVSLNALSAALTQKAGFSTAMAIVLEELASNPRYRTDVMNALRAALSGPGGAAIDLAAVEAKLAARASAAAILAAVQIAFLSGDLVAIIKDLHDSLSAESWQVTAVPAVVRIAPTSGIVDKNNSQVRFEVTVRDQEGPLAYRWSTTGTYGHVYDYATSGTSIEGTSSSALYQVENPLEITDALADTVTVEVFPRDAGGGIAEGAVAIGRAVAQVKGKVRNLDGRFFVQHGAMNFRIGPVPCAVMFLRFPKSPGATGYTIHFANYGGGSDRDYNNNAELSGRSDYTFDVKAEGDRIELSWDEQCYDSHGALAGFALSPMGDEYWLATYMSLQPLKLMTGEPWEGLDLAGVIELWYEWLDDAEVTITPH